MSVEKKPVKGYNNYVVYKDGRVYSKNKEGFVKPMRNLKGYLRIGLWKNGERKLVFVHRLVAEHFHGCVKGKQVHHKNRIISCNAASNLEIVSDIEHYEIHGHKAYEEVEAPF